MVADNLDIGRPDHVELIFAGHRKWPLGQIVARHKAADNRQ